MIFKRQGLDIFIFKSPIDMRCGFEKLTGYVRSEHGMQKLLDGHVFVFFGKNRRRVKILFFDGTGLLLLSKRLEQGRFQALSEMDVFEISFSDLEKLLHGSHLVRANLGKMPKRKSVEAHPNT
jgi:hypothetical protein